MSGKDLIGNATTGSERVQLDAVVVHVAESDRTAAGTMWERLQFFVFCAGIFVCYFYYGILQENITKSKYGDEKEPFTYTISLVFIQCIINSLFAYTAIQIQRAEKDTTSYSLYARCSFTYVMAMLSSNAALRWVSYPTQVLGKSVKPIPVMILGVLVARKVYPWAKYLFVLFIVTGVALFMYKDKKATSAHSDTDGYFGFGEILLVVSLTMDGLTGAMQDRMRSEHRTKPYHMMLNVNLWSLLYMAIGLLGTGEGLAFVGFVQRHPQVLRSMLLFSVCSALGQNFIFLMVSHYGPLPCSIVTTTRKFFTILASVFFFGHTMVSRQWMGTVLVFIGLALDSKYGKEIKPQTSGSGQKAAVS